MTNGWNGLRKELVKGKRNNTMKAVAIPYIIALILGVIIIGLLGYWLVSQGSKTISTGEQTECTAKQSNYCNVYQVSGFKIEPGGFTWTNCQKPTADSCKSVLGISCGNGRVEADEECDPIDS